MAHLERDLFTIRRVLKAKKVHCTVRLTLSVSLAITILEASRQSVALNTQRPPRTGNHESRGVADGRHAGIHAKKSGIEGFSSAGEAATTPWALFWCAYASFSRGEVSTGCLFVPHRSEFSEDAEDGRE